jgi:hypothetical protein
MSGREEHSSELSSFELKNLVFLVFFYFLFIDLGNFCCRKDGSLSWVRGGGYLLLVILILRPLV